MITVFISAKVFWKGGFTGWVLWKADSRRQENARVLLENVLSVNICGREGKTREGKGREGSEREEMGREWAQILSSEKLGCEAISMKSSADATGRFEAEIPLQICPKLRWRKPGLCIPVSIQLLNFAHSGKGTSLVEAAVLCWDYDYSCLAGKGRWASWACNLCRPRHRRARYLG